MELKEIQELIRLINKLGISEVSVEKEGFKLCVKNVNAQAVFAAPVQVAAPAPPPVQQAASPQQAPPGSAPDKSNFITIKSPMIGTFYRKPAPDKDPFVKVGSSIQPGTVLCTIEAMKLFNEIESEVSGRIVEILAEDASPVEYDQPLFLVEPA